MTEVQHCLQKPQPRVAAANLLYVMPPSEIRHHQAAGVLPTAKSFYFMVICKHVLQASLYCNARHGLGQNEAGVGGGARRVPGRATMATWASGASRAAGGHHCGR